MKTKRKYTKLCALLLMLVMLLTACGEKNTDNNSAPATTNGGSDTSTTENTTKPAEDVNIEDWGVYYEAVATSGEGEMIKFSIKWPLNPPNDKVRKIALQEDCTTAMVGYGGTDFRAESVEDVLPACTEHIIEYLDYYRPDSYDNFSFTIDSQESVKVNDFPACKYTGTHSFTDDEGVSHTIPFVAYSLDLQTASESYIYVMVLDDSELHPKVAAVEDGVIEDYAYKMALSVKLR